jgi:hypothetical protein
MRAGVHEGEDDEGDSKDEEIGEEGEGISETVEFLSLRFGDGETWHK